ncbi:Autophagy- protein 2 A, partial [Perkinsus olseni]
ISAWISSLIPSPEDTPNPPSSTTRQNDEEAPEKSGPRLCVIEDFDEGDAQPSDSPPAVTPMEPLSLEEEVSVWEDEDDPWPTHGDSDAHNASPSNLSSQESLPPPPSRRETLDCYGGVETSATWFAPLDGALINGEHFGCSVGGSSAGRATPMRSSSGATTPSRGPQEGHGLLDGLEVRVTASQVELKLYDGKDWSEKHGTLASLRQVRMSTRAKRPTICAKLKDVGVTVISKPGPSSSAEGQQQISLWLSIGDVTIIDLLQASVYQYILVYYEGNKGDHPKGTNVSMVLLRFDSSPGGRSSEDTQISHSRLEISILPLRLTLDQDTLHWLDAFADSVNMYVYAAMDVEAPLFEEEEGESTVEHIMPSTTTIRTPSPPGVWLDSVKISELLVCIDYRCKRVNMRRLRRGDRAELINLLPILEGLEVKFRSAHLQSIRSVSQLSELLI